MLLNQETLRLIFGLKLRNLRQDRKLSLKDLAKKTGLSPSYLNEIEKGKKYPKPEKISLLTENLGASYDDLISIKLKRELSLISQLLEKGVFQQMPFDVFGIPANVIFELLAEHPKKMRVLIGSLLEVARAHSINVEDFLYAILRAYLDMHQNYFPELEEKAQEFSEDTGFDALAKPEAVYAALLKTLTSKYKITVAEKDFLELGEALRSTSYFWSEKKRTLVIDQGIKLKEKNFILARQIAYQLLKVKEQPRHTNHRRFESFDQLFDHFSANYMASCLLIPKEELCADLKKIFDNPVWDQDNFTRLMTKYACMPENIFYRMSQLLPTVFGIENLFVLRYDYDQEKNRFEVLRELHLANLHSPHAVKNEEHYCARWVTHKMANRLVSGQTDVIVGGQRSKFYGTTNEYLVLTCGFSKSDKVKDFGSVSLGITINEKTIEVLKFLNDKAFDTITVSEVCERCPVSDCKERLAPLDPKRNPQRPLLVKQALQTFEDSL
jgi:hypothetical protein